MLSTLAVVFGALAVVLTLTAPSTAESVLRPSAVGSAAAGSASASSRVSSASSASASDRSTAATVPTSSTLPSPSPSIQSPGSGINTSPVGAVSPSTVVIPSGKSTQTLRCNGNQASVEALTRSITSGAQPNTSLAVREYRTGVYCGYRDSVPYVSASIVKVATTASLMRLRRSQGTGLSSSERNSARLAITISDNAAQQRIWLAQGGSTGLERFIKAAGMTQTQPSLKWGLTTTTARDQVILLDRIAHGSLLTSADRSDLLEWMRGVATDQRWGVPTYAPSPSTVAVKNGWLPYDGSWRVNSIGWVKTRNDDYVMAVLSTGNASYEQGQTRTAQVARTVHRVL